MTDEQLAGVGATALMTAAARALERRRRASLLDDPWAEALAGERGFEILRRTDSWLFTADFDAPASYVVRHKVYDDFVLGWTRSGVSQVVLVAAGLDTRAYRLEWPAGTHVYELDQPEVLRYKAAVIGDATARCQHRVIEADLREHWTSKLLDDGFDPTKASIWVAEGLLFYLPEPDARRLLDDMAGLAAHGSHLLTQTMRPDVPEWFAKEFEQLGAPFVFRTEDGVGVLGAHGWDARDVPLSYLELGGGYRLWLGMYGSTLVACRNPG